MFLSERHEAFRKEVREFAEHELPNLRIQEKEEENVFPKAAVELLIRQGLTGVPFPEKYGGAGKDTLSYCITVEEISRVWGSLGLTLAAHISLGSYPIYHFGTEEQKQKYLAPLARGEVLGSFGLTEPGAGSDASATKTVAEPGDGHYVLSGSKNFITTANYADTFVVTAVTDRTKGAKGISAFIVERNFPGFSIGKKEDKLGLRASDTATLVFDNCQVPEENLLGQEGQGFKIFMVTLDGGRISIGAMALGIAQASLDECLEYVRTHKLQDEQWVQEKIADMTARIQAARHLVYHSAWKKDAGEPFGKESAIAKYFASETATGSASSAISIMGLDGISKRYPAERFFRDAKLTEIGEGTSQIQKIVIARNLFKERGLL
ncbi:MAG: acyl-CoA dehydrogenase family protein [Armatimonadetes bacterium]|nr:acyl-CoA dehydrogenase family protein [Armatimonadota bacterium]